MNLVIVHSCLDMLSDFFDRVTADAGRELDLIEARRLAGDFASFEDYENVVERPFVRIKIAARAVAYELVALVEGELHHLAHEPWLMSSSHKEPKNILQLSRMNHETLAKLRMVSDLPFGKIVALVEDHFGIVLDDIEGWASVLELRDAVNAFKHRRGFKHPRDLNWRSKDVRFPERYTIDQEEVKKALVNVASLSKCSRLVILAADVSAPENKR